MSYAEQPRPEGIAQAFIIGAEFIGRDSVCLVLGDNLFYGHGLAEVLRVAAQRGSGATILGYYVSNPQRYGVVTFDTAGKVINIEEKPKKPRSSIAVTGLYFYDNDVVHIAADLKPSLRGELEITDVNQVYISRGDLHLEMLGRGTAWLDTGTDESLLQAGQFIETIESRQGLKVACPEELAWRKGYIDADQVRHLAQSLSGNGYGRYLLRMLEDDRPDPSQGQF